MFARLLAPHMPVTNCETLENALNHAARGFTGGRYRSTLSGLRVVRPVSRLRAAGRQVPGPGGGVMIGSISGQIKAKAALVDPSRYGRSDTSAAGRWFWEIDKVLLLLLAVLIGIGLIAVAAASPAAGQRYSGGSVQFSELHYFYRQIVWIAVGIPVMIGISMMPPRARQAPVARGRGLLLRPAGLRPVPRPRDERRDALDRHRHRPASAVGVPEALLRRGDGLAAVACASRTSRCRCSGFRPR